MFGTLRLLLSISVLLFHAGYSPFGVRFGVSALVVFYMLSGYVISALYQQRFVTLQNAPLFYRERLTRILPQYYFYLILTAVVLYGLSLWSDIDTYQVPTAWAVFNNLTLLPLGLNPSFYPFSTFALIGPTVSLATELLFYLAAPLLFQSRAGTFGMFVIGFTVFMLGGSGLLLPAHLYTYTYQPGAVIFFIIGHWLQRRYWKIASVGIAAVASGQLMLGLVGRAGDSYNVEVYLGFCCGLAALILLGRQRRRRWDEFLGNAAYGVFLGHFVFLVALRNYLPFRDDRLLYGLALLTLTLPLAFLSYYIIERPTLSLRRKWRSRKDSNLRPLPSEGSALSS